MEQTKSRAGSPEFYDLMQEMADLHDKKSHDYTTDNDPFGNYRFSGLISTMFGYSANDAGFAGRLAEKIYRIYALESRGAVPKNESVADTERDIAVIAALWMASRREARKKREGNQVDPECLDNQPEKAGGPEQGRPESPAEYLFTEVKRHAHLLGRGDIQSLAKFLIDLANESNLGKYQQPKTW